MIPYYAGYGFGPQSIDVNPQGFFGSLLGGLGGGAAGRAIGGLFGNPNLGGQIGNIAGGLAGGFLPFQVDPWTSYYGPAVAPQGFLVPQSMQEAETQASNAFYEDAAAQLIQHLYEYLKQYGAQYKELKDITPLLQRSADLYEARNFQGAFLQLQQVYRFIVQLRSKVPGLPIP